MTILSKYNYEVKWDTDTTEDEKSFNLQSDAFSFIKELEKNNKVTKIYLCGSNGVSILKIK
jgi:hypothetical protein